MTPEAASECDDCIVGVGIDVVAVDELDDIVQRRGHRFVDRVFTAKEIAACASLGARGTAARFATSFAAKEAAFKALGTGWIGDIRWQDVELLTPIDGGKPEITMHGEFERLARAQKVTRIHTSVSSTPKVASAMVVLVGEWTGTPRP